MHPTLPSFADALALRVYRRNIGLFLQQTAQDLGLPFAALCPSPPADRHRVTVDAFGLADSSAELAPGRLEKWLNELSTPVSFRTYPDRAALAARLKSSSKKLLPRAPKAKR